MNTRSTKWSDLLDNRANSIGFTCQWTFDLTSEADLRVLMTALQNTSVEFRLSFSIVQRADQVETGHRNFHWPAPSVIRFKSPQDAMLFKLSVNL